MKVISDIINLKSQLDNCASLAFEKENDILSCIKSTDSGVKLRQKKAAAALLDLNNKKTKLRGEINSLLKALDNTSYENKKLSGAMIIKCIQSGIEGSKVRVLKQLYSSI